MKLAIIGCGTVGSATAKLLLEQRESLKARTGMDLELKYIVDIDFTMAKKYDLNSKLFCKDYLVVLRDSSVDTIVELIGGLSTARKIIKKAIAAGKHVVTANKALMAHHTIELITLARNNNVTIGFEASCGGGIPIIRAITEGLIANRTQAIYGILNGTCNYILTEMGRIGKSYQEALSEAQALGYAEADPTLDVSGHDTAHKLTIMATLAFGAKIDIKKIPVTGIDTLEELDVSYGQELGYVVKLLAIAKFQELKTARGLSLCVRPAFISKEHPLAWVSGTFNSVSLYGDATGHTMHYGRGAGGSPTASAIIADLCSIAAGTASPIFKRILWSDSAEETVQLPERQILSRYYIRVTAEDAPGVLARIASKFGDNDIGIRSVLQKEPPPGSVPSDGVPVVITTYEALEGAIRTALKQIDDLEVVKGKSVCIEIVDEHPEQL